MATNTFTASIHKEENFYVATCVEVGTVSQGSTMEEALANLKEATELYLEEFPVKENGTKVMLYNGKEKNRQDVHAAVLDINIGNKDLQQCADAVMRLRAEYLYKTKQYDKSIQILKTLLTPKLKQKSLFNYILVFGNIGYSNMKGGSLKGTDNYFKEALNLSRENNFKNNI